MHNNVFNLSMMFYKLCVLAIVCVYMIKEHFVALHLHKKYELI